MKYNIPKDDCEIHEWFTDSINPKYHQEKYCKEMCNFKCKKGLPYKKVKQHS
jgi:hypothetical protein